MTQVLNCTILAADRSETERQSSKQPYGSQKKAMSKQHLSDEQIVELGKKIWTIIEAKLETEHGWDFQETVHDVQMYMYATNRYTMRQPLEVIGTGFQASFQQAYLRFYDCVFVPALSGLVAEEPGIHAKGTIVKGVGFVEHASLDDFIDLVLDPVKRKLWDHSDFYDVVATIDENTDVCHVGVPNWGPISARDFVSVRRSVTDRKEGSYCAVQVSIEYPLTGREHMIKKHVRGTLLPSCWKFIQKEGGCECHYISGVQLGGWVPQAIVNKAVYSNTHSTFFQGVRKIFKTLHEEKAQGSDKTTSASKTPEEAE